MNLLSEIIIALGVLAIIAIGLSSAKNTPNCRYLRTATVALLIWILGFLVGGLVHEPSSEVPLEVDGKSTTLYQVRQ